MKRLAGTDGRKKRASKRANDDRKLDLEYGREADLIIAAALREGDAKFCAIHGSELEETHPADVENGPSPDDVENRLVCWDCEFEIGSAAERSECLVHRLPIGYCPPCSYVDVDGVVQIRRRRLGTAVQAWFVEDAGRYERLTLSEENE